MPPKTRAKTEPVLNLESHACIQCGETKKRSCYWDSDWGNRSRAVSCKTCETRPPSQRGIGLGHLSPALRRSNAERLITSHTCAGCRTEKPRAEFWSRDLSSRCERRVECKACRPTPPGERQPKPAKPVDQGGVQEQPGPKKHKRRENVEFALKVI